MNQIFNPKDYGAAGDGKTLDTKAIQTAIDRAGECKGTVHVPAGTYLTGSLFLKSHMEFHMEEGVVLLGTLDESAYPFIFSRVAGIEMEWPAAILNLYELEEVKVTGFGTINGQGEFWWDKYWGPDRTGGMRRIYDAKDLRWVADYDCTRPRNLLVFRSKNIVLQNFTSKKSAFWNVHICYSEQVHVDGITVKENEGPSTDGIDIDSSRYVMVENCTVACNDDNICIKSGRDADGLRVNLPSEEIEIKNCRLLVGAGVTLGSETSGGIRNVFIHDNEFLNTDCGFRMKSAMTRGGILEDIRVENLMMINVRYPFSWNLNWHPKYSYCELPEGYEGEIPDHWKKLLEKVPYEKGIPKVRNITVRNVKATMEPDYRDGSRAFDINAYSEKPMENILFEDVDLDVTEFGRIAVVENIVWKNVKFKVAGENDAEKDIYDVR